MEDHAWRPREGDDSGGYLLKAKAASSKHNEYCRMDTAMGIVTDSKLTEPWIGEPREVYG